MVKIRVPSPHIYALPRAPFISLWNSLPCDCELREIINEALDALKEDRCAGIKVEKNKIPKSYNQFGIDNLTR